MTGREAPSSYSSQVREIWAEEYEAGLNGQIRS
jgi:hypothetical protein